MVDVRLPRNVQFMYEHALAHMEFREAFGTHNVEFDILDPWHFSVEPDTAAQGMLSRAAFAGTVDGNETLYSQLIRPGYQGGRFNRTRSVNQYLTHWIYPYKGKFHPQIIRAIINITGMQPGNLVLDPFIGSGTTALECTLLGIDSLGIDVSPLCVKLTGVKAHAWNVAEEARVLVEALTSQSIPHPDEFDPYSFTDNDLIADFLEIGRMVTYSDMARRNRDPSEYFSRNLKRMLQSISDMAKAKKEFDLQFGNSQPILGDARDLRASGIQDESIDGIITSPPYSIALDYVKNDEHALKAMKLNVPELRESFIGVRGRGPGKKLALYELDLQQAIFEMARVLKPGAPAVIVIGNATVNGTEHRTTDDIVDWCYDAGLVFEKEMPKIAWGLYGVVADEKILFLRRS